MSASDILRLLGVLGCTVGSKIISTDLSALFPTRLKNSSILSVQAFAKSA